MRTVVVPYDPPAPLLRALRDVRAMVGRLLGDWRGRPEESRFEATKRCYPVLRAAYPHLGSGWAVVACNETSATLASWDRALRHARRYSPEQFARMRSRLPRRVRLKASLHPSQYRMRDGGLDVTIHRRRHVAIDLRAVRNPLFQRYRSESGGRFGLSVTDRYLLFHFHTPDAQPTRTESVGVDANMPSLDFATSSGSVGSVDLRPITRIQGAMARKRAAVQRAISKDLRHQRAVLRRYHRRERRRVTPLLHAAANELLASVGDRNLVLEDLSRTSEELVGERGPPDRRRRLSAWTHGRLDRILSYKSHSRVVRVNPRGTSSECPRCGGPLAHPSWRRATCGNCQVDFHRDRMAAVAILSRGEAVLWGSAHTPNALPALLESARWRPSDESPSGPPGEAMNGDTATTADW